MLGDGGALLDKQEAERGGQKTSVTHFEEERRDYERKKHCTWKNLSLRFSCVIPISLSKS